MNLKKFVVKNYKLGATKKYRRCQHIIKSKWKNKKGEQCRLPVIIGDFCHRHINNGK